MCLGTKYKDIFFFIYLGCEGSQFLRRQGRGAGADLTQQKDLSTAAIFY